MSRRRDRALVDGHRHRENPKDDLCMECDKALSMHQTATWPPNGCPPRGSQ